MASLIHKINSQYWIVKDVKDGVSCINGYILCISRMYPIDKLVMTRLKDGGDDFDT